jgi:hypothetical protein
VNRSLFGESAAKRNCGCSREDFCPAHYGT